MTNITMLARDRTNLTQQALYSLYQNTKNFNLTIFDDASKDTDWLRWLVKKVQLTKNWSVILNPTSHGTGNARNQVIAEAEKSWGRGDYLYLSDNDVYFRPHWLEALIEAYEKAHNLGFRVLGAYNHPYNHAHGIYPVYLKTLRAEVNIGENHALAMQSWLLKWETWDRYGQFVETPVGRVRMSEDFEWCQRLRNDGYKVGSVYPPLIYNTGRTDSFGEPIPGADIIPDIDGVLVE